MPSGCVALLVTLGVGSVLDEAPVADSDEIPVVATLEQAFAGAPETEIPARPTKVRHRVRPRERITQIAVRYGITREALLQANKKLSPQATYPKGHRYLKVKARRLPPPRRKIRYVVKEGESWMDIATAFRVEHRDLHAYNWKLRELKPGTELTMWVDPGWPRTIHPDEGPPVPAHFNVPLGGLSVGRPHRGRLQDGVPLPESDLYTRRPKTSGLWGSTHALLQIQHAFASFRHDTGFEGEVIIGAISRRHGGRFAPHRSHQSGRDIDIRMPLWPGLATKSHPHPDEIDWYATWGLVRAFIETGEVAVIFLDVSVHRRLYEAARTMGETPESLDTVLKWPRWTTPRAPIIRHSEGHDTHIHVRIKCGPDEPRCRRR